MSNTHDYSLQNKAPPHTGCGKKVAPLSFLLFSQQPFSISI